MVAYPLFYLQLCALGILQAKYLEAVGSQQQVTKVDQQLINSYSNNEKALYESNELRKKGLCLVPISMLINYLGWLQFMYYQYSMQLYTPIIL